MVEKLISTGSSDRFWVVVESGRSEGDVIVMEGTVGGPEPSSTICVPCVLGRAAVNTP